MSMPLNANLDLKFSNSCNCFCFGDKEKVPVYLDGDFNPIKYNKRIHGEKHIEDTYKRIESLIEYELCDHSIDEKQAVEMIEKMAELSIRGEYQYKEPIKVYQLRKVIRAIERLRVTIKRME